MKITSFFINKFKEVSLTAPSGIQEDGGVYGDETNYLSWVLGNDGDTVDFDGIVKTNILFGELYKITLDTGNAFNPTIPGGVPNINGFMNMDLNDYWANIFDDIFKFNNLSYSSLIRNQGNQSIYPTLIQYANSAKERVGWVEVNRTRPSIYYNRCSNGKRARSDHFYDVDKFLMTAELFDLDAPPQIMMSTYRNINPYTGENERYYTTNMFAAGFGVQQSSIERLGLTPIGNWFTWINNPQGHFRTYNNVPENIGGYLDMFPWPRGPMWGQYSGMPKEYLSRLVTGNQLVLDANLNDGPRIINTQIPDGLGTMYRDLPLLIAKKSIHLEQLVEQRLQNINSGTGMSLTTSVSDAYPVEIWGEIRKFPSGTTITIPFAIDSEINNPSYGVCQPVDGLDTSIDEGGGADGRDVSILDPYGFDLYQLDKEYKEVYKKYKFCPPRKKVVYSMDTTISDIKNPNPNTTAVISVGNNEEYLIGDTTRIVKIGPFNPDAVLPFDLNYEHPLQTKLDPISNQYNDELSFKSNILDAVKIDENLLSQDLNKSGDFETSIIAISNPIDADVLLEPVDSIERDRLREEIKLTWYQGTEIDRGIRSSQDFVVSSVKIPYGTYKNVIEKTFNASNGTTDTTIKVMQNGADADLNEFKEAVSTVTSVAETNKTIKSAIGVNYNGLPIYPTNTLEESLNSIKEQLTGFKEIIFRGSDVLYGAVSFPLYKDLIDPIRGKIKDYDVSKKFEYVNTGINVSNTVDLNKGEKLELANHYHHQSFYFNKKANIPTTYLSVDDFMAEKEKDLISGEIDFIGKYEIWSPFEPSILERNAEFTNHEITMQNITHILVSKFDGFGIRREKWGSTLENPNGNNILETKNGYLYIDTIVVLGGGSGMNGTLKPYTHIFEINGQPLEYENYYKIPVKLDFASTKKVLESLILEENPNRPKPSIPLIGERASSLFSAYPKNSVTHLSVSYSTKSNQPPSTQNRVTSSENTFSGWVFQGLYHRDGSWPKDFKNGWVGLLDYNNWQPIDGGVNTGGWIKVNPNRVRLEFHNFASFSRNTVYSYIHDLWLAQKTRIMYDKLYNPSDEIGLGVPTQTQIEEPQPIISPYYRDNLTYNLRYEPDPLKSDKWESWEKILDLKRTDMINALQEIKENVLILRLRDNDADPARGLSEIKYSSEWEYVPERLRFGKRGHFLEFQPRATFIPSVNSEEYQTYLKSFPPGSDPDNPNSIPGIPHPLDKMSTYLPFWYPEPVEHTRGEFKKDEWYRLIFTKAVTSPDNPSGDISGYNSNYDTNMPHQGVIEVGKYKPNDSTKKIFCDVLYVTEQILKMHRARLVEMKKYADKKIEDSIKPESLSSSSGRDTFYRSLAFISLIRDFAKASK